MPGGSNRRVHDAMVALHSTLAGLYNQQTQFYDEMTSGPYTTVVLVTGANQGIGFEICKKLGTEHPDYHIIVTGRRQDAINAAVSKLRQSGASVEGLVMDVTSDESIYSAANTVARNHGRLDVLINNAGICPPGNGLSRKEWKQVYDTNVFGMHSVTEAFIPLLDHSQTVKRIVNITSTLGSLTYKADPSSFNHELNDWIAYSSSKTAVTMLTLHYAIRFEQDPSWKINLCCPGPCATNLNNFTSPDHPANGAINACRLATLGPDGETATWSNKEGLVPW